MNIERLILTIIFSVFSIPLLGMEKHEPVKRMFDLFEHTTIEDFINENLVSDDTKQILDAHLDELLRPNCNSIIFHMPAWLDGYIIKEGMSRLMGALHIRNCSQKYNLPLVSAPVKKFYHIPGRPTDFTIKKAAGSIYLDSFNYLVVAQKIRMKNEPFTLQHIQQIYKMIKRSLVTDIHYGNVMHGEDGKAYIIDTHRESFSETIKSLPDRVLFAAKMMKYLDMETEARDWLKEKINKMEAKITS